MKVTICGSMIFNQEMKDYKTKLEALGFEVAIPKQINDNFDYNDSNTEQRTKRKIELDLINAHYKEIISSEAILILNFEKKGIPNYIGGNTFLEMGFAFVNNRDIFLMNPSPDLPYRSEIEGMQPIIINSDINKIKDHYVNFPKVFLSSNSKLKIDAVSMTFREYKIKSIVEDIKTSSGVSEEPISISETYNGALNRLKDLKTKVVGSYEYLVSIEGGLTKLLDEKNLFGVHVCVVENKNGKQEVSIVTDIEFPKAMTDLIPSIFPDTGVLVQQKYKASYKDPYLYITKGKLSRTKIMQSLVYNALSIF